MIYYNIINTIRVRKRFLRFIRLTEGMQLLRQYYNTFEQNFLKKCLTVTGGSTRGFCSWCFSG